MSISDSLRQVPGVAQAEGAVAGAFADEGDLPIADYGKQSAEDIASRLKGFSQRELRLIDAYERKHGNRATITDRVAKLLGDQPWAGYDEQDVDAVAAKLGTVDSETARKAKGYERDHKDRAGVMQAADKRLARS